MIIALLMLRVCYFFMTGGAWLVPADRPSQALSTTVFRPSEELLNTFIAEVLDHVQRAETALLTLETQPTDTRAVDSLFRAFHTIKGTSAFLPLHSAEQLAQAAEPLIDRARQGQVQITGGYADLILDACDALREIAKNLENAVRLGNADVSQLPVPAGFSDLIARLTDPQAAGIDETSVDDLSIVPRIGDILVAQGTITREEVERIASQKGSMVLGQALLQSGIVSAPEVAKALRAQKQIAAGASDSSVRVSAEKLDRLIRLMDGVAPLCKSLSDDNIRLPACDCPLPQAETGQAPCTVPQQLEGLRLRLSHWQRSAARLGRVAQGLDDLALSMRMTPLRPTFQLMSRVARDLSHKSGKPIHFVTEGANEEIGRNMVEAVNDSLIHLIRNAIDHGIEPPDERTANGKPKAGEVSIVAFRNGNDLVIQVRDDGRGLEREKILAGAQAKGLVPAGNQLNDKELFALIFLPGFSTAKHVTGISGRGVGLDVVRLSTESVGGRVEVSSLQGRSTTFTVRVPLRAHDSPHPA